MFYNFYTAVFVVFVGFGCVAEPQKVRTPAGKKCGSTSGAEGSKKQKTPATASTLYIQGAGPKVDQVTFYQDILPILSANVRGKNYKCITCHAHYTNPDGLNNVPEIERIVASLKSGSMPRSNDRVPPKYIELFDVWRLQGFGVGDPKGVSRHPDLLVDDSAKDSDDSLVDGSDSDAEDCRNGAKP